MSGVDPTVPIVGTILGIFTVFTTVGSVWFWKRRPLEPIKSRRPYMVLLHVGGMYLYAFARDVSRELHPQIDCQLDLSIAVVLTSFFNTVFLLRMGLLILDFVLASNAESLQHKSIESREFPGLGKKK
jgi:hypothetical protein